MAKEPPKPALKKVSIFLMIVVFLHLQTTLNRFLK